jgi:hypothetical protein
MNTLFLGLLVGCGLKDVRKLLPEGPAVTEAEWDRTWGTLTPSGKTYSGDAKVDFPVLPLQVWGAQYDLDLVVVSEHPRYDMHEYARIASPNGPIWVAKDALAATLQQSIISEFPDIETWSPELPVVRKHGEVDIIDASTEKLVDVRLRYTNLEGEPVEIHYVGPPPRDAQKKRNGSAMGHSADILLAVLDIPYRTPAKKVDLTINGKAQRIHRIAGLVPFQMALAQTQGGLATADFSIETAGRAIRTTHMLRSSAPASMPWTATSGPGELLLEQPGELRTLRYRFLDTNGSLELTEMSVQQVGAANDVVRIRLSPALPDMRRPFEGRAKSRFVIDVNGQRGHAVGTVEAFWEGDVAKVRVLPEAPWWVADRPMESTLHYGDARVHIDIVRIP